MPTDRVMPIPLALLICDGAHRDPATGKWTLLGLFNSIRANEFPVTHGQLVVYLAMTDVKGKLKLTFRLVDLDEDAEALFQFDAEMRVDDPRTVAEVVIPVHGARFPSAGEFRLQVFVDGQFLVERRMMVIR